MSAFTRWKPILFLLLVCTGIGILVWTFQSEPESNGPQNDGDDFIVKRSQDGGFVGSSACKDCHASQHASWHRSFHRTMTQVAAPETVLAPFKNEELEFQGRKYRLSQEEDRFFVSVNQSAERVPFELPDPNEEKREIVMTTGSHHIQVYWVSDPATGMLVELPFYYHLAAERWMLRNQTMLHPPGTTQLPSRWNDRCIKCHSVNGVPGMDQEHGRFNTQVAELGIACEACHGPGQAHVEFHRDHSQGDSSSEEHRMVNPPLLRGKTATQVCGRCHSASQPLDPGEYLQKGLAFLPGDNLHDFIELNQFDPLGERPHDESGAFLENYSIDGFWKDGTCRVGGDEYNALIESPCYEGGNFSCLSCHSMHASDPDDQLAKHALDNRACTQCHAEPRFNSELATHTHHAANSSGSQCYNCHMPHISYALLKAMRNHRITVPSVRDSVEFQKPNACNLCHLDRTLEWTAHQLSDWHGSDVPEFSEDEKTIAASLLWLHKGNAPLRIITAWHIGWGPALEASGTDWQAAFISGLLDDPYSAIRFVAMKSLNRLPGFESFEYDFLGTPPSRSEAARKALAQWKSRSVGRPTRQQPETVLMNERGELLSAKIKQLLRERDHRPVSIAE